MELVNTNLKTKLRWIVTEEKIRDSNEESMRVKFKSPWTMKK